MINKELIENFIKEGYLKKGDFVASNKVHNLFCTIYNLNSKYWDIRAFMPKLLPLLKSKGFKVTIKKIRLKDQGNLPRNCIVGVNLNIDLNPKKEQEKEQRVPSTNNKINKQNNTNNDLGNVTKQKKERVTKVDLTDFVRFHFIKGNKTNVIGSDTVHTLCLDFYKEDLIILKKITSKTHFTQAFKKSWDIVNPKDPLITLGIRDPKDRKKRGIACIIKKGS